MLGRFLGLLTRTRCRCRLHWAFANCGCWGMQDPARVVRDGEIITGGGVTAGIDMALTVMAEIAGRRLAEAVQLGIEYAPQPPFAAGRPEEARAEVLAAARGRLDAIWPDRLATARRAGAAASAARA